MKYNNSVVLLGRGSHKHIIHGCNSKKDNGIDALKAKAYFTSPL